MPKMKEYFPLTVSKMATKMMSTYQFSYSDMKTITEGLTSIDDKDALIRDVQAKANLSVYRIKAKSVLEFPNIGMDYMDYMATVIEWSENKQVYKPDIDFLQELIATDDFHICENMFDYLPCKVMYFDFADNDYIYDTYDIKGIFVKVIKNTANNSYELHMIQMIDDKGRFKVNTFCIKNEDGNFQWDLMDEDAKAYLKMAEVLCGKEYVDDKFKNAKPIIMVFQLLCYLASIEPDIHESQLTKSTYRPRKANQPIKNKFSEVQQHEVGIRFGTAFRKHKAVIANASSGTSHKHSSAKRPHYRKAHWGYYWYNVLDDNGEKVYNVYGVPEKVKRPKWIEATFVNENYGETDVVIHKVIN